MSFSPSKQVASTIEVSAKIEKKYSENSDPAVASLEKLQRSSVYILRDFRHLEPINVHPETTPTSHQYSSEGLKRGPKLDLEYSERHEIIGQLM